MPVDPSPHKFAIDGKEYDRTKLSAEQNALLQQCQDLHDKRRKLEFEAMQNAGALEFFVGRLRQSLIDSPPTT